MKNHFIRFPLIVAMSFIWIINSYSQKVTTILLNKKIYALESYNPMVEKFIKSAEDSSQNKNDKYLAGDYSDSLTQFRLVVERPGKGASYLERNYTFYVSSYKCDTVYVGLSDASTNITNTPIIGVGKRKFKITLVQNGSTVQVEDVSNSYLTPDAKLFENKLPNDKFQLLSGGTQSLLSFEHQHKLIYAFFWVDSKYTPLLNNLDTLKEVYNDYKDKVNIISLLFPGTANAFDTNETKKVITERHQDWIQGYCDVQISIDLLVNGSWSGMLFDENGNVIKMFILPGELKAYLKKKYGQ